MPCANRGTSASCPLPPSLQPTTYICRPGAESRKFVAMVYSPIKRSRVLRLCATYVNRGRRGSELVTRTRRLPAHFLVRLLFTTRLPLLQLTGSLMSLPFAGDEQRPLSNQLTWSNSNFLKSHCHKDAGFITHSGPGSRRMFLPDDRTGDQASFQFELAPKYEMTDCRPLSLCHQLPSY